jgi:phosphomevalonate kinase
MKLVDMIQNFGSGQVDVSEMRSVFMEIRRNLQIMTKESGAAIEPPEQSAVLDACMQVPGVIGGVVPGAGGYDAICLLVMTDEIDNIKAATSVLPLFDKVSWLDLHEEGVGLREEPVDIYSRYL